MKKTIAALLTAGLLSIGMQAPTQAKPDARHKPVAAGPRWDRTITMTADGFPVMGNPNAPVKVVEFISYTCSHCAEFSEESKIPLDAGLVRKGKVSVELRPFIRISLDQVPTLLALCGRNDQYFGNTAALLAAQGTWFKPPADPGYQARWAALESKPTEQRLAVAKDMGLYKLMLDRGYTGAALTACLSDQTKLDWLNKQTEYAGTAIHVLGTPSFMIDGVLQDVYGWAELAPRIDAALVAASMANPVSVRSK
jgi:protein-disulfide isomerase